MNPLGAISCRTNIDFRILANCLCVAGPYCLAEIINGAHIYQIDGTAAKTASSHPRAVDARDLAREINHNIKFFTTDFIVITQAFVGLVH